MFNPPSAPEPPAPIVSEEAPANKDDTRKPGELRSQSAALQHEVVSSYHWLFDGIHVVSSAPSLRMNALHRLHPQILRMYWILP